MKLQEVMTQNIEFITADSTVCDAAVKMASRDVGFLPVVEDRSPAGVITDRDIVIRCIAQGEDPRQTPVSRAMTPAIEIMNQEDSVEEAARLMKEKQIRRLMVVDSERRLVGVVALGDLAVDAADPQLTGETLEGVSQGTH